MSGALLTVKVDRIDGGRALVEWTVEGSCPKVDVAWGRSPDGIDHERVLTVEADAAGTVIEDLPSGSFYVSVSPEGRGGGVIAGLRNLGLTGPSNFRDLGGYSGVDGRRVRWGKVFRSDALVLDDEEFDYFASIGIKTVYDLRSDTERETTPNRLPDGGYAVHHAPLIGDGQARAAIEEGVTDGEAFLSDLYVQMLEVSAPVFGAVLTGLADEAAIPAVFHCAAGKDRTGMVAGLLLLTLGVSDDDVLDDYELTSRYRKPGYVESTLARLKDQMSAIPEAVAGILRTPRWAMKTALETIETRHGGVEGYLTGPAGVARDVPEALRRSLLTP